MHQETTRNVSGSVLVCIALTSGAMLGMAAQTALYHVGLDFGSVRDHLLVHRVAHSRSALAWWAWWLVPVAAFFTGPLSVAVTRYLAANWWLLRGPRLLASAAVVVGLAAVGNLSPAPSSLGIAAGVIASLMVVTTTALLALLGVRPARSPNRKVAAPGRAGMVASPPPPRGGGSANAGLPMRRVRPAHALARRTGRIRRLALVAALGLVMFAVVSLFSGAAVVLDLVAPGVIRDLVARHVAPATPTARRAREIVLALLPADEIEMPRTGAAPAPFFTASRPGPLPVPAVLAFAGATMSEIELTFAQGYIWRHAAQRTAGLAFPAIVPEAVKPPVKLTKPRVAALRLARYRRIYRQIAADRRRHDDHFADRNRYADDTGHGGHHRRRGHERYGHDKFARLDRSFGEARF
jgi:hypothetical protein